MTEGKISIQISDQQSYSEIYICESFNVKILQCAGTYIPIAFCCVEMLNSKPSLS